MLAFVITTADKVRVLGLILLVLLGVAQWLRNILRSRGRASTIALLFRMLISAFCGVSVSLLTLHLAKSCANAWCLLPLMPGFFIGALTPFVGVHRDDNLLWYVTGSLNATMYGLIAFALYPLLKRKKT